MTTSTKLDSDHGGQSQVPARERRGRRISGIRALAAVLLTLALVSLAGVLLLETGLRLFASVTDVAVTMYDTVTGPRIAPNQTGNWVSGDHINVRFRFNAQGWNHPRDYAVPRVDKVTRVCMVGDSQIESLQVEPGQAMFSVAEEQMVNSGRPAEWYGFGNSGWGTAQHIEVIRHYVLDYHPDAVILLFVQNDPFDCSPYLVDIEPHVPRYSLDDSGELILRPPSWWEPSGKSRLAVHSALFRYFIVQKHVHLRHGGQVRDIGGLPLRDTSALQGGELDELSRLTMREREEKTWQLIEAMFRLARDECHSRGAILAIAFRGWHDEIDAPIGAKMPPVPPREEDPWCLGSRRCEMGREQVGPIAERLGIPYLDLTAALCDEVAKSGRSHRFPDDNHFNAMAHRAAGAALAKWVHRIVLAGNFTSPSPRTDQ